MSMPMTEASRPSAARAPARADEERWRGGQAPRPGVRRQVLLRRPHHRRLLPAELRLAAGEARERLLLRDRRGGGEGGLSRLQALPARQARRARSASRGGAGRRANGSSRRRRRPSSPSSRRGAGLSPYPLPSRLQDDHRRDAEGLCGARCGRAARPTSCARRGRSPKRSTTPGSTPRAASTRTAAARLGMTPSAVEARRRGRIDPLRGRRRPRSARCWSRRPTRACARSCSATIPTRLCASLQDRFPRAELEGGDAEFERMVAHGGRPRRGAGSAPRSSARHPRHRVPAAGLGGAARHPCRARRRPTRRSRERSASRKRCARSRRPAPPIRSRSRSPAIGWCAPTATSPAIAGASSASAS